VHRLIKFLSRHGRIQGVALMADVDDGRVMGAVRQICPTCVVLQGYILLPAPAR
jgi:hypothetical protein